MKWICHYKNGKFECCVSYFSLTHFLSLHFTRHDYKHFLSTVRNSVQRRLTWPVPKRSTAKWINYNNTEAVGVNDTNITIGNIRQRCIAINMRTIMMNCLWHVRIDFPMSSVCVSSHLPLIFIVCGGNETANTANTANTSNTRFLMHYLRIYHKTDNTTWSMLFRYFPIFKQYSSCKQFASMKSQ